MKEGVGSRLVKCFYEVSFDGSSNGVEFGVGF